MVFFGKILFTISKYFIIFFTDKEHVKPEIDDIQPSTLQQIKGSVQKFLFSSDTDSDTTESKVVFCCTFLVI